VKHEPTRYFFVHLQKTAGTSFSRQMKDSFGRPAIYPSDADGDPFARVIDVDHLLGRWQARRDEIRVVTGHFPLCTAQLLDAPFVTFTILRDPVDRTLSYLRHHRKVTESDRDLSLEEVYEDPGRFNGLIHNHMVKMFSLTTDEMTNGALTVIDFTSERLERAMRNLEAIDLFGLQKHFAQFCAEANRRFDWNLGPPLHMNRTEATDVPAALVDRIVRDNAMDLELYEFACELHAQRYASTVE
jgi:Sulfotransferase family